MEDKIEVIVCMGSACFARGNQQNLEFIEKYVSENGISAKIDLGGSRCEGRCADGPNIIVDGIKYDHVNEEKIKEIFAKFN